MDLHHGLESVVIGTTFTFSGEKPVSKSLASVVEENKKGEAGNVSQDQTVFS